MNIEYRTRNTECRIAAFTYFIIRYSLFIIHYFFLSLSVASFWYTAWVNAGQPNLKTLAKQEFSPEDAKEFEELNNEWKNAGKIIGRQEN